MKSAEPFYVRLLPSSLSSYSNVDGNLYILHYIAAKKFVSRNRATIGNPKNGFNNV